MVPSIVAFSLAAALLAGAAEAGSTVAGAARMRAIVHRVYGSPDVLRLEEVERPACSDDRVLVRVRAASVNPLDWHYVRGEPYVVRGEAGLFRPRDPSLGVDFAGEVEAVGAKTTRFKPGDAVFGNRFGAFAEYVCASERAVAAKPANLSFEEAAAVPVAAITALQGLRDAGGLRPGQKVLVNGASGGVGTFAVQIAKALGAEVTGVCSGRNVALVRGLGADDVVDYTKEDFTRGGRRYDLILDMVGGRSISEIRRALTPGGTLVIVGSTEKGRWLGPLKGMIAALAISPFVRERLSPMLAEVNARDLEVLRDLLESGKVRPVIDRRYALAQVPEAIRYVEAGHARGKVVIAVDRDGAPAPLPAGPVEASAGGAVALFVLGVAALLLGPVAGALALDRRFRRRHPGARPFRFGYWFALQSLVAGVLLGVLLESGAAVAIAVAAAYALLAWAFARRRRWAWIALTALSLNPVLWVVNWLYLRKGRTAPAP